MRELVQVAVSHDYDFLLEGTHNPVVENGDIFVFIHLDVWFSRLFHFGNLEFLFHFLIEFLGGLKGELIHLPLLLQGSEAPGAAQAAD